MSATTRPPRPGEVDGVAYHFLDDAAFFDALVAGDGFVEWAHFGGFRYGTPWSSVEPALRAGRPVILEIDVQGALQVRRSFPDVVLVFIRPRTRTRSPSASDGAAPTPRSGSPSGSRWPPTSSRRRARSTTRSSTTISTRLSPP